MDQFAVAVSSLVHQLEGARLPVIPVNLYVKTVCVGVAAAVLLHETSDHWLSAKRHIPVISYFLRKWRQDPDVKATHLRTIRNVVLFFFFVVLHMDSDPTEVGQPCEYVESRLTNATAQRTMNREIYNARREAYNAADALLGEEEVNLSGVEQQRDAALRRRYIHDSRVAK